MYEYLISDKPSEPENLHTGKVTDSSAELIWEEPEDNGGCPIKRYIVEMREPMKKWTLYKKTEDLDLEVTGLSEGVTCNFRVAAENEIGVGPWAELGKGVTPKSEHGKCG